METNTVLGWLNWPILILCYLVIFVIWSWVPLERLDHFSRWNNPVVRPLINTLILTGLPALYAKITHTPMPGLLIVITFFCTQYAILRGRFIQREFNISGWVMVITAALIWVFFFFG